MKTKFNKVNMNEFTKLLQMSQKEVKRYSKKVLKQFGYTPILRDGFLYAEGNAPIVLLSHMDTVCKGSYRNIKINGDVMTSTNGLGADDRAGIYGILELVRKGYRPTILMLEDEEIGCVGANKFTSNKDIKINAKYMIELDRMGSVDSVYYDCDHPEFEEYINSFGFETAIGSFSDISIVAPHVGLCAVNLSVGYYKQHTTSEYMVLSEFITTMNKVEKMIIDSVNVAEFEYVGYEYNYNDYAKIFYSSSKKTNKNKHSNKYYKYSDSEYKPTNMAYSYVFGTEVRVVECPFCYVCKVDGRLERQDLYPDYMIGEDEEIYTINGSWVQGAECVDDDWNRLGYDDFLFGATIPF